MIIEEWQAKKLYINKEQLERALGISLAELPTKQFQYQEPIPDYLIIYQSMPYFDEYEAAALLLGLNPSNYRYLRNKPHFYSIHKALLGAIKNNELGYSSYIDFSNGDPETLSIEHRALEKWAKHHGYKWELQPYQPLTAEPDSITNNNNPDEIARLNAIIEQQTVTIARLEAEVENLKKPETAQATHPPTVEEKQNRISQPQRDIFTLLVMNNYQNCQSRNRLFEAINADMRTKGIRTSDIKYPTLDNLIDDNLKINNISPFPPKQK